MKTELNNLKPFPKFFELNKRRFFLNPFTLFIQTWVDSRYTTKEKQGTVYLAERLEALDPLVIAELTFMLLSQEDQHFFGCIENFVNKFSSKTDLISRCLPPLTQTLIDSQPEKKMHDGVTKLKKPWARRLIKRVSQPFMIFSREDMGIN